MDHTVLPANNTMPAFPSWRSPDVATTATEAADIQLQLTTSEPFTELTYSPSCHGPHTRAFDACLLCLYYSRPVDNGSYLESPVLSVTHPCQYTQHELDVPVVLLIDLLQVVILHHRHSPLSVTLALPLLLLLSVFAFVSLLKSNETIHDTTRQQADIRLNLPNISNHDEISKQVVKVIRHKTASPPQTGGSVVFVRRHQCALPCGHIGSIWRTRLNLCFLRPTRVHNTNDKSIGSAVLAPLNILSTKTRHFIISEQ